MVNIQDMPRCQGSCLKVLLKLIYLIPHQIQTNEIMTLMVAEYLILTGVDFYGFISLFCRTQFQFQLSIYIRHS